MKKIIGMIVMLFIMPASLAFATDATWFPFVENGTGKVYVIKNTLEERSDGFHSIWLGIELKPGFYNADKTIKKARTVKMQNFYNCNNKMMKVLNMVYFDKNGSVVLSEEASDAFEVVPGSVGADVREVACYRYWNKATQTY